MEPCTTTYLREGRRKKALSIWLQSDFFASVGNLEFRTQVSFANSCQKRSYVFVTINKTLFAINKSLESAESKVKRISESVKCTQHSQEIFPVHQIEGHAPCDSRFHSRFAQKVWAKSHRRGHEAELRDRWSARMPLNKLGQLLLSKKS